MDEVKTHPQIRSNQDGWMENMFLCPSCHFFSFNNVSFSPLSEQGREHIYVCPLPQVLNGFDHSVFDLPRSFFHGTPLPTKCLPFKWWARWSINSLWLSISMLLFGWRAMATIVNSSWLVRAMLSDKDMIRQAYSRQGFAAIRGARATASSVGRWDWRGHSLDIEGWMNRVGGYLWWLQVVSGDYYCSLVVTSGYAWIAWHCFWY